MGRSTGNSIQAVAFSTLDGDVPKDDLVLC